MFNIIRFGQTVNPALNASQQPLRFAATADTLSLSRVRFGGDEDEVEEGGEVKDGEVEDGDEDKDGEDNSPKIYATSVGKLGSGTQFFVTGDKAFGMGIIDLSM